MGIGDTIAQRIQQGPEHSDDWWNTERTKKISYGVCFVGSPIAYCWAQKVERLFPGTEMRPILQKMAVNNAWAFFVSIPLLFTTVSILNGRTFDGAAEKVKQDLAPTFVAGLVYWPFANLWTFRLVSEATRPYATCVSVLAWNVWLSTQATKRMESEDPCHKC